MATKKKAVKVKDPKAKYYSISNGGKWIPIEKGSGGKLSDISLKKFKYPSEMWTEGSILFDDGTVVDKSDLSARKNKLEDLVKILDKQYKTK